MLLSLCKWLVLLFEKLNGAVLQICEKERYDD